jgi:NAD(P) transhydrogenase
LGLEAAGVKVTPRGLIEVDNNLRTSAPNIYAAGDVIGPPALASTSMEQGRRAACHALGLDLGRQGELAPAGIYTIPELGSVGLTEQQVRERYGDVFVGRAKFEEVARGQISAAENGLLKLVVHPETGVVLGAHAAGESATELVHIGQMAIIAGLTFETFIDTVFNFPTFAEAYRVAAFDLLKQQRARVSAKPAAAE